MDIVAIAMNSLTSPTSSVIDTTPEAPEALAQIHSVLAAHADTIFKFRPVKNGLGRITVVHPQLRLFLHDATDCNLLRHVCL